MEKIFLSPHFTLAEMTKTSVKASNHLTGCAADIRCLGPEQALRYMTILLDISDGLQQDFDELIMERRGSSYWIHLAVRPKGNRRKVVFDVRCKK